MPEDKIGMIRKIEEEAEKLISQATLQAKEILNQSRKQAYKIVMHKEDEGVKEAKKIIKNAKDEALVDIVDIQHDIAGKCNEIRRNAKPYKKDATKFVAERITK